MILSAGGIFREAAPAGTRIRSFILGTAIAQGGEGIIYEAKHSEFGDVLIKEFWPRQLVSRSRSMRAQPAQSNWQADYRRSIDRFLALGERLRALAPHPGVMPIFDVLAENNTAYLVMKRIAGRTLEQTLDDGRLDPEHLARLALQLSEALAYLHDNGLFHRDVAPDNIIVTPGHDWQAVLIDFSAAKDIVHRVSRSTEGLLKPGYTPAEQYDTRGIVDVGAWSDIYAASAVLYRCLSGETPMDSGARLLRPTLMRLASDRFAGQVDAPLLTGIDAGFAPRPEDRPQSVREWQKLLGVIDLSESNDSAHAESVAQLDETSEESTEEVEQNNVLSEILTQQKDITVERQQDRYEVEDDHEGDGTDQYLDDPVTKGTSFPSESNAVDKKTDKIDLVAGNKSDPGTLPSWWKSSNIYLAAAGVILIALILIGPKACSPPPLSPIDNMRQQFEASIDGAEEVSPGLWLKRDGEKGEAEIRVDDTVEASISYATLNGRVFNGSFEMQRTTSELFPLGYAVLQAMSYGDEVKILFSMDDLKAKNPGLYSKLADPSALNLRDGSYVVVDVSVNGCVDPALEPLPDSVLRMPCLQGKWIARFEDEDTVYDGVWVVPENENSGQMNVSYPRGVGTYKAIETCEGWVQNDVNINCSSARFTSGNNKGYQPDNFELNWAKKNTLTGTGYYYDDNKKKVIFKNVSFSKNS